MTKQEALDIATLTHEIRALALRTGAELVGFTTATNLEKTAPPQHRPSKLMPQAQSVITLACGRKLNENRNYKYEFGPHYIDIHIELKEIIRQRRNEVRGCIEAVKHYLRDRNYTVVTEPHGWSGILSFKQAAYLGGIGVYGKGNFIVHPTLGPLNVLACILTDAPIIPATPLTIDLCQDCIECIKSCKYHAFQKVDNAFQWLGDKCRCYDLIMNPVTLKWIYGPCNSDCANKCPLGENQDF
jgi:epoxyqueuosine reductase QueG